MQPAYPEATAAPYGQPVAAPYGQAPVYGQVVAQPIQGAPYGAPAYGAPPQQYYQAAPAPQPAMQQFVCIDPAGVAWRNSPNLDDRKADGFGARTGDHVWGDIVMGDGGTRQYLRDSQGRGFAPMINKAGQQTFNAVLSGPPQGQPAVAMGVPIAPVGGAAGGTTVVVVAGGAPQPVTGRWTDGLCDCSNDWNAACVACCFLPVRWATTVSRAQFMSWNRAIYTFGLAWLVILVADSASAAATYGTSANVLAWVQFAGWVMMIILGYQHRVRLREKYQIPPNPFEDCLVWTCCSCCAAAQEGRHVDRATGMTGVSDPAFDYPNATFGSPDPRPTNNVSTARSGAILAFLAMEFMLTALTGVWATETVDGTTSSGDPGSCTFTVGLWNYCSYGSACARQTCYKWESDELDDSFKGAQAMAFLAFIAGFLGFVGGLFAAMSRNAFTGSKSLSIFGLVVGGILSIITISLYNKSDVPELFYPSFNRGSGYVLEILAVVAAFIGAGLITRA